MGDAMIPLMHEQDFEHLANLFKAFIQLRLKLSPYKCQFFGDHLTYIKFMLKVGESSYTPIRDKCDAIINLQLPRSVDCILFCGLVNFLSPFLKDIMKHLIPIYKIKKNKL